jgi:PAS domain-containing protein
LVRGLGRDFLSFSETKKAEQLLDEVLGALSGDAWAVTLDRLDAPAYLTDQDGNVTYWNRACVDFAGREPALGQDRWCVTWKLYSMTGEPLAHDACPMAVAIKQRRSVRNAVAIAERPDGSRRAFAPYPTPLFDEAGALTGAVNLLIDVTVAQGRELRVQADRCRRLAKSVTDAKASRVLDDMAIGYERTAASLSQG